MLSAFSAIPDTEELFGIPFAGFEGGFTPWDYQEPLYSFQEQELGFLLETKPQEPVMSHSGSDNSNPKPVISNSVTDEPKQDIMTNSSPTGSYSTNPSASIMNERKLRRKISNRESARRSRMRKRKHLEDLRSHVNRLQTGKQELMSRLRLVTHHCQLVWSENDRLLSESELLRRKLWGIHQVLQLQQHCSPSAWPCNIITSLNNQNPPSLIT
ncbi:hypothetical protein U1Q18_011994 [Sarracenia purpurea var. burkii]